MFGIFFTILFMGHFYVSLMVIGICSRIFYEIIQLKKFETEGQPIEISSILSWYFFIISILYSLIQYFSDLRLLITTHLFIDFERYKKTIFFFLVSLGFMFFIMTLKKKHVKDQIGLFFYSVLAILYCSTGLLGVVVIYDGLIWFLLSILLVSMNDTFALLGGKFFGKTPLWKLSPKKTVEGFIVGFFGTIFMAVLLGKLSEFHFMNSFLCP